MKWIKASERLPEKQHNYHVKVEYDFDGKKGTWNTASLWDSTEKYWQHPSQYESWTGKPSKLNVVEWLDESPTEIGQQGNDFPNFPKQSESFNQYLGRMLNQSQPTPPQEGQDELWDILNGYRDGSYSFEECKAKLKKLPQRVIEGL